MTIHKHDNQWSGTDYEIHRGQPVVRTAIEDESLIIYRFEGWCLKYRIEFDASVPQVISLKALEEVLTEAGLLSS